MENKELDKVTAFDTLFTTNHIQMYKILLSYMPPSLQKTLAVYIKFSELIYTISFLRAHPNVRLSGSGIGDAGNIFSGNMDVLSPFFDELMPYLSPAGRESAGRMKNMMQNMKNMQDMMEMIQMMQDLFPEGGQDGGGIPGMDMDPSFISQMMQMFGSMDMSGSADMPGSMDMPGFMDMSGSMEYSADSSADAPAADETLY